MKGRKQGENSTGGTRDRQSPTAATQRKGRRRTTRQEPRLRLQFPVQRLSPIALLLLQRLRCRQGEGHLLGRGLRGAKTEGGTILSMVSRYRRGCLWLLRLSACLCGDSLEITRPAVSALRHRKTLPIQRGGRW